jgi:alginate O-acetyltransferase complex protein AlgI
MNTCSVQFFVFCALLAIIIPFVHRVGLRQAVLVAANLVFLATLVPSKRSAACLALFIVATYVALRLVRDRPSHSVASASTFIVIVLVAFLFVKRYTFVEWMLPERAWRMIPEVIGISYMLFKFIHMVVDQSQGQLAPFTFTSYASYQLLFFTITAGPIQRYNDFHNYWEQPVLALPGGREVLSSWSRLMTGTIKAGLLAPVAWGLFEQSQRALLSSAPTDVISRFTVFYYSYPVYMYLNFSGYADIVIGAARLIGLSLPENFNRPYLARNVIDFWNRWHISLSHWIRDYVFMTWYKASVTRFPKHGKVFGVGLLFFSLFLSGIWHGSTAGFAIFGAIHGFGAAANRVYTDALKSWLGRERFKRYENNRLIHWLAILVTLHFVFFAFVFFSTGVLDAFRILGTTGQALLSGSVAFPSSRTGIFAAELGAFIAALLVATWYRDAILSGVDRLWQRLASREWSFYAVVFAKAFFVAIVLIVLWGLEKEPEIAYMRF